MGVELFKHNAVAYDKVKKMFETENRVAVVHPTGCGKSFISLKWLEENKAKNIIFLAPSISILEQIEKHIESCGMSIADFKNLKRFTYSKMSNMTDDEIKRLNFDMLVLDEFHRCGANEWSKGITTLINNNLDAKILGISATPIRYLDEHRDMAEELFLGNIASEITLEDAMINGILPMPTYINAIYSFQEDIESMQEKINKEKRPIEKLKAQQCLDEAKKILEKAEGLPEIFQKHMKNKSGKYIVFCKDKEHMKKMIEESKEWFKGVNDNVDIYSMASFNSKSDNLKTFEEFYHSDNDHLKLLFSIDMLNEGVHVPNIDGVIMLRPTESPIIFKQQLGRALSVGHNNNPLIFDIVNNIQSCEMVSHFYKELRERALVKFNQSGSKEDKMNFEAFEISDIVREIQNIFSEIDNYLKISWEDYYELALEYYVENKNLLVPYNYIKNGINLGNWISNQRRNTKLNEIQKQKLKEIEMIWDLHEYEWEVMYKRAEAYYQKHGNLSTPKTEEHQKLYKWICKQRTKYKSYSNNSQLKELSPKQIQRLESIGMIWDVKESQWNEMYESAKKYYEKYGSLVIPNERINEYKQLFNWLHEQKKKYKSDKDSRKLSQEQIEKLELLNIIWDRTNTNFNTMYEEAKEYYEKHGMLLDISRTTNKELANWIKAQRRKYTLNKLSEEEIENLEAIGMIWDVNKYQWNEMYTQATDYFEKYGNLSIPKKREIQYKKLQTWIINNRRALYGKGTLKLNDEQIKKLQAIGIMITSENQVINNTDSSNLEKINYQLQFLRSIKEVLLKCKNEGLLASENIYDGIVRKKELKKD